MNDQARMDAMNDAETLRLFAYLSPGGALQHDVRWTGAHGSAALAYIIEDFSEGAAVCAWSAARSAFRACPGLR